MREKPRLDAKLFPGRLKLLRKNAGLTQGQLAESVGSNYVQVSRMERGEQTPSLTVAVALANALGCDLNAFCSVASLVSPKRK